MQIRVLQTATHLELAAESRSAMLPEPLPLLELTEGTPSISQTEALAILDTLAALSGEKTQRKALVEVAAPSRSLWLLEHINIWNYAFEIGLTGSTIAYVVTACSVDSDLTFAENYARKLGIALKFFIRKDDAMSWLLSQHGSRAFEAGSGTANSMLLATGIVGPRTTPLLR